MKENIAAREVEVEGMEMIDLGDAMVETRQPASVPEIKDNPITWTWLGAE
ncbi:MAG TPA: hypothetical protein VGD45_04985 [Steroidobacter sp.]